MILIKIWKDTVVRRPWLHQDSNPGVSDHDLSSVLRGIFVPVPNRDRNMGTSLACSLL